MDNKKQLMKKLSSNLEEHQIDLVCLAGYMKFVGPTLLAAYEGRIINIHPAYLPDFRGSWYWRTLLNGEHQSGVTIHWVDFHVDTKGHQTSPCATP